MLVRAKGWFLEAPYTRISTFEGNKLKGSMKKSWNTTIQAIIFLELDFWITQNHLIWMLFKYSKDYTG